MATSKSLQTPQILEIIGSTIRIAHPDISNNMRTSLAAPISAAGTAMSVLDNNTFADDDWFIVGEIGDQETEEDDVNGAVTRGKSLTVTNTLKFDHELDAPVTKIYERAFKIYGAATDGGAGTLIASINAITTPIADAVMIQWNKAYSEYTLISTDTAYAYYYATFTDGTTDSSASDYVANTGLASNTVQYVINQALYMTNARFDNNYTAPLLTQWANDAQSAIMQFTYQDPQTGKMNQMDWAFEVEYDETTLTAQEGVSTYSLSSLNLKYPYSEKGILDIRIGSSAPLKQISYAEYDFLQRGVVKTQLSVASAVGGTTLTVDSNVEFADSGSLQLGPDTLTYTGKSGTTGFTGIPASGSGSITEISAIDSNVWQNITPGLPQSYTVFDGDLIFDVPVSSDYDNYPIKIRFYKKLTALTYLSATTDVTFTNVFQYYIASMIEERRGNKEKAMAYMSDFNRVLLNNALANKAPIADSFSYYNYEQPEFHYLNSGIRFVKVNN